MPDHHDQGSRVVCAEPECDQDAAARGLCNKHYKYRRRIGTLPPVLSLADRLWAQVTKSDSCWEWCGTVNNRGWGYISDHSRMRLVHRVAYEMQVGPIPDGAIIGHLCGNAACVRADHLVARPRRSSTTR